MAISVHNYNTASSNGSGGSLGIGIAIGTVPDGFLLVAITQRSNTTAPSSVRYAPGGTGTNANLTFLGSSVHASDTIQTHLYGLLAPLPSGSVSNSNILWTAGVNPSWQSATVIVLQGVDQSNPYTGSAVSGGVLGGPITSPTVISGTAGTSITFGLISTPNSTETVVTALGYAPIATALIAKATGFGAREHGARISLAASAASNVRQNVPLAVTSGTTYNPTFSFTSAPGITYAGIAFALNASTMGAPYLVEVPRTILTVSRAVSDTTLTVQDTSNFPTAGSLYLGSLWQGAGAGNVMLYTGKTATTFTGVTTPFTNGSYPTGILVNALQAYGPFTSTSSIAAQVQQNAANNDILVVSVTNQGAVDAPTIPTGHPAGADFTLIQSQSNGTVARIDTYWRRIIAGDTAATFTWTWGAAGVHKVVSALYRGCTTSGSPIDTGAGAPISTTGSTADETLAGLTTTNNDEMIVFASVDQFNGDSNPGPSAAPTVAERMDVNSAIIYDQPQKVAGASGTKTITFNNPGPWAAVLFALLKASGAGVTSRSASFAGSIATVVSRKGTFHRTPAQSLATATVVSRRGNPLRRTMSRTTSGAGWTVRRQMTKIVHPIQNLSGLQTVSRSGSRYPRSNVATMPAWTGVVSRRGNPFRRAALRAGSIVTAVVRDLTQRRSAVESLTTSATVTRRGSTYHRIAAQARTSLSVVSRVIVGGSVTWFRNAAQNRVGAWVVSRRGSTYFRSSLRTGAITELVTRLGSRYKRTPSQSRTTTTAVSRSWRTTRNAVRTTAAWLGTVSRAGSRYPRHASRTTAAFLAALSRRGNPIRRSASRTTAVISLTVSRKGTFRRTLGQNRTTTVVVSGVKQVAGVSFFIFGPEPIFRDYDATQYYLPTIFFEVTLRSTTATDIAYARLFDITAGSMVIGSQIQTTAPHNTGRKYRSGTITLVNGHTYRAEQGHGSGYQAVLSSADWIIQVP